MLATARPPSRSLCTGLTLKKSPKHLKKAAKQMFEAIQSEYGISDGPGLALLLSACEARQRADEAAALLRRDGLVTRDRFDQPKAHPAAAIERDARAAMVAALRALKLEPDL